MDCYPDCLLIPIPCTHGRETYTFFLSYQARQKDMPWWPADSGGRESTGGSRSGSAKSFHSQKGSISLTETNGSRDAKETGGRADDGRGMLFAAPKPSGADLKPSGADAKPSGVNAKPNGAAYASRPTAPVGATRVVLVSHPNHPDEAPTSFGWVRRAERNAVDVANAIAQLHRDTRVNASMLLAESIADLQSYVPQVIGDPGDAGDNASSRRDREFRARVDLLTIATALVDSGADANKPMRIAMPFEFKHQLATDRAFPLGIAVGAFADGLGEVARQMVTMLLDKGNADASQIGVTSCTCVASPLFAATRAIRKNVPESVDLWRLLIEKGADVDGTGYYIEGSQRTPLIELLHTLREGVVFRQGVLSLITELLDLGCDVEKAWPEVYSATPHAAYGYVEDTPNAEIGESSLKAPASLLGAAAVNAAATLERDLHGASRMGNQSGERGSSSESASETESESSDTSVPTRVRLTNERIENLVKTLSAKYGYDVSHAQVRTLVGETWERHAYTADSLPSTTEDDDVSMADAASKAEGSVSTSGQVGPGAYFPTFPSRIGTCYFTPLFWALEAVCGDGFGEARVVCELIVDRLGGDVDVAQGTNHHSFVEGSLVAMACAAAIQAAAPMPDFVAPDGFSPNLPNCTSYAQTVRNRQHANASTAGESSGGGDERDSDSNLVVSVSVPGKLSRDVPHAQGLAVPHELPNPDLDNPEGPSRFARLESAAAAANQVAAQRHLVTKLPALGDRSLFRSRARGVLGPSRFEKATREVAREKAVAAAVERTARNEEEALQKKQREANRNSAWRGRGTRTAAGYRESRTEGTRGEFVSQPFDTGAEDDKPNHLCAKDAKLHADLDKARSTSRAGDLKDATGLKKESNPPGLLNALNALLFGGDGLSDSLSVATSPEESHQRALERYEQEIMNRSARLASVLGVAVLFLKKTQKINALASNPLLAEVGAASLAPFEWTALFFALHGGATSKGAEQMDVANKLATLCLDHLDVDVRMPGAHASLGGAGDMRDVAVASDASKENLDASKDSKDSRQTKNAGKTFDANLARQSALRSYPLMWCVATALRRDNPLTRVDDVLQITKRVLMKGADPTTMNIVVRKVAEKNDEKNASQKNTPAAEFVSNVLHLWDERCLLLEVFHQHEFQRVMTLRLSVQKVRVSCFPKSVNTLFAHTSLTLFFSKNRCSRNLARARRSGWRALWEKSRDARRRLRVRGSRNKPKIPTAIPLWNARSGHKACEKRASAWNTGACLRSTRCGCGRVTNTKRTRQTTRCLPTRKIQKSAQPI